MDIIDGLKAFVATAQSGSFTEAATRMGISNRLTSKYVAELETRLGVRLLQRTTRRVGITPAGEALLARAPGLLDNLAEMLADITEESRTFTGTIRISAPVTFGEVYVKDLLSRFSCHHPNLTVDLRLDDTHIDLAKNGIDLAFRIGELKNPGLKARRLGWFESFVVASPDYIQCHAAPLTPNDLINHTCIVDTNHHAQGHWAFLDKGKRIEVDVPSRFFVNSAQVTRDLAIAGKGITYCPHFVIKEDLENGRLVRLLPDFESVPYPLNAIYLEGHTLPLKIRALIDFARLDIEKTKLF